MLESWYLAWRIVGTEKTWSSSSRVRLRVSGTKKRTSTAPIQHPFRSKSQFLQPGSKKKNTREGRLTAAVPEESTGRRKGVKKTRERERDDEVCEYGLVSFRRVGKREEAQRTKAPGGRGREGHANVSDVEGEG